jgi:hypothetical protein
MPDRLSVAFAVVLSLAVLPVGCASGDRSRRGEGALAAPGAATLRSGKRSDGGASLLFL